MTQERDVQNNPGDGKNCGQSGKKILEAAGYATGGAAAGAVLATELGVMSLTVGGIAVGAAPVIAAGAIAGLTIYLLFQACDV